MIINKSNAIKGNLIQKKMTAIEMMVYQKVKVKNLFFD